MTSRFVLAAVLLSYTALGVACPKGTAAQAPAFEASVRTNRSGGRQSMTTTADGVVYTNVSLSDCLAAAYGVKRYQISGPGWIRTERYDISARAEGALSGDQRAAMLRALLADRFKTAIHHETKVSRAFALSVDKTGAPLDAARGKRLKRGDDNGSRQMQGSSGDLSFTNASMADLVEFLSGIPAIGLPVVDTTGLAGRYDFSLTLFRGPADAVVEEGKVATVTGGPSPFMDALKELGLKLESRTMPLEILVVDRADRVPTAN